MDLKGSNILGNILGALAGTILAPGAGTILGGAFGSMIGGSSWNEKNNPGSNSASLSRLWNDITGKSNTEIQNSAAAAMQEDAQAFNSEEAQKERDWQTMMSNTAVQRQVADLQAAGLNPALAAGNGASSGMAASASSSPGNPQASNVSALQSVANSAITAGMLIKIFKTLTK